jgi:hypothetical protein
MWRLAPAVVATILIVPHDANLTEAESTCRVVHAPALDAART